MFDCDGMLTLATLLLISFLTLDSPLKTRAEVQGEGQASCGPATIYSKARSKPWTSFEVKVLYPTILMPFQDYIPTLPLFFSRKANHLRDKQQHQIARRLPEETSSHGHSCRSRACLLLPSTSISPSFTSTQMSNQPITL